MLRILAFYANHKLDCTESTINLLTRDVLSKMNQLPIPDEALATAHTSLVSSSPNSDLSRILEIKRWCLLRFPGSNPEVCEDRIVSIGPLAMRLVITPDHIMLPSILYYEADWYSPKNKDVVQSIRSYYREMIKMFSGDHALYVKENIADNHFEAHFSLHDFEQYLMTRYGAINTKLFAFGDGKYPKYYIDTFDDIGS